MSTNQFEELQLRYIADDSLSNEEAKCLVQWLDENPNARQEMLADETIDSQLRCMARISDAESLEEFVQQTVDRAVGARKSESINIVVRADERDRTRSLQAFRILASVCAVALILIGIAYCTTLGRDNGDFGFAKITNVKNLTWKLIDDENRRVRFSSGDGAVHFENGTVVKFSAPAVIELNRLDNMFVEFGLVNVNVPPPAVGFTVQTPTARIVDYGTKFDVDVDAAGQTETLVRSGVVTFETHSTGVPKSDPIKLTANGFNRASTKKSLLSGQRRSFSTMASGMEGQFYGTIRADGKTVEFTDPQALNDFQELLDFSPEENPANSGEQSNLMEQQSGSSASTMAESSGTVGGAVNDQIGFETNSRNGDRAHKMLINQIRAMQERHQGNEQMQQVLERMIQQAEQVRPESSK